MTPYERLMAILNGKKEDVDRIPCINSASVCTIEFMKVYNAYWPAAHMRARAHGGTVTEQWRSRVGSDAYGKDAVEAVDKVKMLVEEIKAAVKLMEKKRKNRKPARE